jgi:hypothetical protein
MFACLSDAVRIACGKWIATLADPAVGVCPRCLSTTQGVGVETESLESSSELFQFLFERFVRDAEDVVDMHLHVVEIFQAVLSVVCTMARPRGSSLDCILNVKLEPVGSFCVGSDAACHETSES